MFGLGSALPAALVVHGCRSPTQVTLEIATNVVCSDMRGIDIVVSSDTVKAETRAALASAGPRFTSASTNACSEGAPPRHIGTLVVTPEATTAAVVVIGTFGNARPDDCTAARFAPECIVARRRFTFVDHTAITLPIVLDPSCAGIPCNATSTCVGRKCVDSEVDCSDGKCREPGVASDGGVVEVDGASPIPVAEGGPPTPPLRDAAPDVATINDAAPDAPKDSGPDGNVVVPISCKVAQPQCAGTIDTPAYTCAGGTMCCYGGNGQCSAGDECLYMQGCCRGASDCAQGEVCCASTPTPGKKTTISCKPAANCEVPVCSRQDTTCGGRACPFGAVYSQEPDFFRCS